jgi:hypothetical protein
MKNFFQKIMFSSGLIMFLILASTLTGSATIEKGSEILVVEVIFGFDGGQDVSGVYLSYPNGKTESIALVGYVGKENIEKNGVIITKKFNDLYSEGWTLENSCGGDNSKRYLFIK